MVHQKAPMIVGISGLGTLCLALFMTWYGFPKIINMQLREGVSMENGTESFTFWQKTPFPLKFKVYIFNIMNPDEMQNGEKPIVKEMGPYIYDIYITKDQVEIDKERDTVKYYLKKTFYFNSQESACRDQDDIVTVLNAALVGTVLMVNSMLPTVLPMVTQAVPYIFPGTKNIFQKVKVRDMLFDGILLDCSASEADFICQSIGSTAPETIRKHDNDRDYLFSLFHHLNATERGPYVSGMGMKNTSRGEIFEYREEPNLGEIWQSPYCNMLNGTDSTVFAPFGLNAPPKKRLYTFSSDLCRSLYVELDNHTHTFDIPVYHYSAPERLLRSKEVKCFCPLIKEVPKCTPAGTFDLQPCLNSPTVFSWPHFYLGDDSLLEYVSGLEPDKDKHETFAEVEPMTGTPVRGAKRAQFNMPLQRLETFDLLANITPGILPMLWIDEYAELPPFLQVKLTDAYKALTFVDYTKYGMIGTGLVLILVSIALLAKRDNILCFTSTKIHNLQRNPEQSNSTPLSAIENDFNVHSNANYPHIANRNNGINGWKGEQFLD